MKTAIAFMLALTLLTGCGAPQQLGEGSARKLYPTYGIINEKSNRSRNVCYKIPLAGILVGILLFETIFVPVYIIGWDLYEPVRLKRDQADDCTFD
jgi:hypothetical protein